MLARTVKNPRTFLLLGLSVVFGFLAYALGQEGTWAWLQVSLGAGMVLAFDAALGRGMAFNLPRSLSISLLALVALYLVLDLAFPGTLVRRLSELAGDPFLLGVLLALFLFRPVRLPKTQL